jgi:hypothetical protein
VGAGTLSSSSSSSGSDNEGSLSSTDEQAHATAESVMASTSNKEGGAESKEPTPEERVRCLRRGISGAVQKGRSLHRTYATALPVLRVPTSKIQCVAARTKLHTGREKGWRGEDTSQGSISSFVS